MQRIVFEFQRIKFEIQILKFEIQTLIFEFQRKKLAIRKKIKMALIRFRKKIKMNKTYKLQK